MQSVVVWNLCAVLLFLVESYHVLGHLSVLLRIRLLPRKDVVRIRYYFFIDGLSSFVTFVFTGQLRWLVTLHVLQHLYYFLFWEKSYWAKRIVDWSSLDWFQSQKVGGLELDNILGTLFDILVHVANLAILSSYLSTVQIFVLVGLAQMTAAVVLFNPRLAWASPSSLPPWVQRRIATLPASHGSPEKQSSPLRKDD